MLQSQRFSCTPQAGNMRAYSSFRMSLAEAIKQLGRSPAHPAMLGVPQPRTQNLPEMAAAGLAPPPAPPSATLQQRMITAAQLAQYQPNEGERLGDMDFEEWFALLAQMVQDKTGGQFTDKEAVRGDYLRGHSYLVASTDIVQEYLGADY